MRIRAWMLAVLAVAAVLGAACVMRIGTVEVVGCLIPEKLLRDCRSDFWSCGSQTYKVQERENELTLREIGFLTGDAGVVYANYLNTLKKSDKPIGFAGLTVNDFYNHPNTIFTHGLGLQPENLTIPLPAGKQFPLAGPETVVGYPVDPALKLKHVTVQLQLSNCRQVCTGAPAQVCDVADPGNWNLCGLPTPKVQQVTVLRGSWSPAQGWQPDDTGHLTIACGVDAKAPALSDGAISKCIHLAGYCPGVADGSKTKDRFEACVRAVTAQYCGGSCGGRPQYCSYTNVGTYLNLYTMRLDANHAYTDNWATTSNGAQSLGSKCPACGQSSPTCYEGAWDKFRAVELGYPRVKMAVGCSTSFVNGSIPGAKPVLWSRVYGDGVTVCSDPDCPRTGAPSCQGTANACAP